MARLFISATTKGLKSYRIAAAAKLRELGHEVVVQDEFQMVPDKIATMLADQIAPCDAVILLIGPVFGAKPADWPDDLPWRSYTQLEYDIAVELQKPVYRFIATEKAELDDYDRSADPHQPMQDEYRRSMADYLFWTFNSQSELLTSLEKSYISGFARHNLKQVSLGSLFKGRSETLQELHRTLVRRAANKAVITANQTIAGLGGVGKTTVTLEYAWKYCSEYSARLYLKADSPSSLRQNLAELAGTLKIATSENLEEQYQAVLNWLHTNARWLLILDNVDTEDSQDAVLDLLPQLTNGHVLITSRRTTWSGPTDQIALDVLSEPAAVEFLLDRTVSDRKGTATDGPDAATLARLLGYLPLALEQAGAFIARNAISFATYLQRWRSREQKVLGWNKNLLNRYDHSVLTTWAVTFDQLDPDGQGILHLLCWLAPDPIPVDLIKKQTPAAGADPIDSESGILNLVDFSFLKRSEDKQSVIMHRLVQEIARHLLPQETKLNWLQRSLQMLNDFCVGNPQDVRTWPTIYTPVRPHLSHILPAADKAGISDPTTRLINELALYAYERADFTEAEALYRRGLAIDEASYGARHPNIATGLNNLAELLRVTNRPTEAEPLYRRALQIDEASYGPTHPKVAIRLNNLALLLRYTNYYTEAESLFRLALSIDETSYGPEHPNVAIRLNNLADLLNATNRSTEAEPLFRRALAMDEYNYGPDHPNVAIRLNNLGNLLCDTNRPAEAEPILRRALSINEASYGPKHPSVATVLNNLALSLRATNRSTEAEALYRRALSISETSYGPDHPSVATSLNNLANLLYATNRVSEAEPLSRRHVEIFVLFTVRTGHVHPHLRAALGNYAGILEELGFDAVATESRLLELLQPLNPAEPV